MTTGTIRIAAAALSLSLAAAPALAQQQPRQIQVILETDVNLTCTQIADEAAQLSEGMGGSQGGGVFGSLTDVAQSGAAMLIPGAGLAIAGVNALTQGDRDREQVLKTAAEHRWYYLNGLYSGRNCQTGAAPATVAPAPAAPQVPPPVAPPAVPPG
jgi:hypothetical protein